MGESNYRVWKSIRKGQKSGKEVKLGWTNRALNSILTVFIEPEFRWKISRPGRHNKSMRNTYSRDWQNAEKPG